MVSLPALPYSEMPKTSFPEALTGALTKTSAVKVPDAGMCTPVVLPVRAKLTSLLIDSDLHCLEARTWVQILVLD